MNIINSSMTSACYFKEALTASLTAHQRKVWLVAAAALCCLAAAFFIFKRCCLKTLTDHGRPDGQKKDNHRLLKKDTNPLPIDPNPLSDKKILINDDPVKDAAPVDPLVLRVDPDQITSHRTYVKTFSGTIWFSIPDYSKTTVGDYLALAAAAAHAPISSIRLIYCGLLLNAPDNLNRPLADFDFHKEGWCHLVIRSPKVHQELNTMIQRTAIDLNSDYDSLEFLETTILSLASRISGGKLDGITTQFNDLRDFISKAKTKVKGCGSPNKQELLDSLNQLKTVVNSTEELYRKGMDIIKKENVEEQVVDDNIKFSHGYLNLKKNEIVLTENVDVNHYYIEPIEKALAYFPKMSYACFSGYQWYQNTYIIHDKNGKIYHFYVDISWKNGKIYYFGVDISQTNDQNHHLLDAEKLAILKEIQEVERTFQMVKIKEKAGLQYSINK